MIGAIVAPVRFKHHVIPQAPYMQGPFFVETIIHEPERKGFLQKLTDQIQICKSAIAVTAHTLRFPRKNNSEAIPGRVLLVLCRGLIFCLTAQLLKLTLESAPVPLLQKTTFGIAPDALLSFIFFR